MTGLSLATRVTGTLSLAGILALAVAAHRTGRDIPPGGYHDAQRAERQERLLATVIPVRHSETIDWLAPRVRLAACGRLAWWIRMGSCDARLRALEDAVNAANTALRSLGPPDRGIANHPLSTVYAVDGVRLLGLLEDGSVTAQSATRELKLLVRRDTGSGQPFAGIAWREHATGRAQLAKFTAGSFARVESPTTTRNNPWAPFSGCAYAQEAWSGYVNTNLLYHDGMPAHCLLAPQPSATVNLSKMPPGWAGIAHHLVAAVNLGMPAHAGPNTVRVYGGPVAQGAHAMSTVLRREQAVTQAVAECMTGATNRCKELGIAHDIWRTRFESAAVRRIGILLMDLATGAIEAAASAHTPCYAQQHDGPGLDASCPSLPAKPARRDSLLANHALFAEAMPGSLIKPITAMALLADPPYAAYLLGPGAAHLRRDIAESNSKAFHERLFCSDTHYSGCLRPQMLAAAAARLGWNDGCESSTSQGCAATNLVTGSATSGGLTGFLARAGIREHARVEGGWESIPAEFSPEWAKACKREGWSKCKGGAGSAVDLLADAWGQGNARATPPGIARMLAALGAAANGDSQVGSPHLLHAAMPAQPGIADASLRPVAIDRRHAALVVSGMALGHRKGGTSAAGCSAAASISACEAIDWIAGKTGTPVFNHDRLTLEQRMRACGDVLHQRLSRPAERELAFHCGASPFKWYAAIVKSGRAPGARWDKVLVVLTERNWDRATGLVDSPGDAGVNIAARAAFESLLRLY